MDDAPAKATERAPSRGADRSPRRPSARPAGPSAYPESVDRLIDEFARLPGIGRRTAERLAFFVLKSPEAEAMRLAKAVSDVKTQVRHCRVCFNLTERELCGVCADDRRDRSLVLVVEQPRDLITLEQTRMHKGVYHVLLGHLNALEGVGPADLTIEELLRRVDDPGANAPTVEGGVKVAEVILGLNPTVEGDGTALYLAEELRARGVKVSRLARGLPSGGQLEYASKAVLADAILGRQSMD